MSKWKLEFFKQRRQSPITYWVHKGVHEDKLRYVDCQEFIPPLPSGDANQGYPVLTVCVLNFDIVFCSAVEVDHFIAVMAQKNLPTTSFLAEQRGVAMGPNSHWLSRFPANLKPWRKRQKLVSAVKKAKDALLASGNSF